MPHNDKEKYKTRSMIKTLKDRKRIEMEYLDAVKRQLGYWNSQIDASDPNENEERFNQLRKNIESEEKHIKQIEDEIDIINEEIIKISKKSGNF